MPSDNSDFSEVSTSSNSLLPREDTKMDNNGEMNGEGKNMEENGVTMEHTGDEMAPAKTTSREPAGGKKRKNDGTVPPAKRAKSTRKEEGKENRSKTQSLNSTPESSTAGSSRVSPANGYTNRRKQTKPLNLCNLEKQLPLNTNTNGILIYYKDHEEQIIANRKFLIRNVLESQGAREGRIRIRPRKSQSITTSAEPLFEKLTEQFHELCTVNFTKVLCWSTPADSSNFATDAAAVQCYTVIVDHQNKVTIIGGGLASVSLKERTLSQSLRDNQNMKSVAVTSEELNSAKYIYYATVVRRMTSMSEKRGSRHSTTGKEGNGSILDPATLKQEVGIGCIRLYEKGKPQKLIDGVRRMILVSQNDSPAQSMLSAEKNPENLTGWMKNASNLVSLHELNSNNQDSQLFRIIFEFSSENIKSILEATPVSPSKSKAFADETDEKAIIHRIQVRAKARFPFYRISPEVDESSNNTMKQIESYFDEGNKITHIKDWTYFKKPYNRTMAISRSARKDGDEEDEYCETEETVVPRPSQTRNRTPGNRKCYGLDFVQSNGHTSFRKVIHRQRLGKFVPRLNADAVESDDEEEGGSGKRKETFVLNNPELMTELALRFRKRKVIPPGYRIPGSEMSVVKIPITEKQKHIWNTRLANVVVKESIAKPRRKNPDHVVGAPDADLDGRPIPGFCEFFFPQAKSELYDILLRHYLSTVGCRPGTTSADWKSRIMTGFITANHLKIFEHKLECIYDKNLQMMGMHSEDWKMHHYVVPRKKMYDLRREWLAKKNQEEIPSAYF